MFAVRSSEYSKVKARWGLHTGPTTALELMILCYLHGSSGVPSARQFQVPSKVLRRF